MPSLHIGIPFVVWLCLLRYDEDRRWNCYRHTVLLYTVVTAFTILYLGIHWISTSSEACSSPQERWP